MLRVESIRQENLEIKMAKFHLTFLTVILAAMVMTMS